MRILFLSHAYLPQVGGVEIVVKKIADHLALRGHTVSVVSGSPALAFSSRVEPHGVRVYRIPLGLPCPVMSHDLQFLRSPRKALTSLLSAPLGLRYLVRVIRTCDPDVVNLHYIGENAAFCLVAKRILNFKMVVSIHGWDINSYPERSIPMRWVTRRTLEVAGRVLSNSAYLLREAEKISPSLIGKSIVVGNGVDLEDFVSPPAFEYGQRYVLCVARLVFKKGIDILIQAFEAVHRSVPNVALVIAGDGPERSRCEALTQETGLNGVIKFLGRVEPSQVPSLLAACEVLVLPSRQEPFGIAILEAMASKKAVIATRVGGVPEIMRHMENGWLVEPECPSELARAIISLLQDTELRARLAEEGYEIVRTHFTWDQVVDKYLGVYREVIQSAT